MRGAALLLAALLVVGSGPAGAAALVADLTSHLIAITTGFVGTEVVLFGSIGEPGDVAVVVTGPDGVATVRRKDQVAGIWVNREAMVFDAVPSYYAVASSRPLADLAARPVLERHRIGIDVLRARPRPPESGPAEPPAVVAAFAAALVRERQRAGVYGSAVGRVAFLGDRLFRTTIYFPATVPTGLYTVDIFLLRDGEVISAQTTPLVVSKVGFSADIWEFAHARPFGYGMAAVAGAVALGWLAGFSRRS